MSLYENVGSAMRFGSMGVVATKVPAYSTIGSFLGLSLAMAAILAVGALVIVGLTSLALQKSTEVKT